LGRDKRKGLGAGYKKAGPTTRFQIKSVIVGIILTVATVVLAVVFFFIQCRHGAPKELQKEAESDREVKHEEITKSQIQQTKMLAEIQRGIEDLTVNLSPQLERKLTIRPVYVNQPEGERYVTLLRGKLKAPYPLPNLRIEAHGETVEEIEFTGTGIYELSDRGKHEGYVFATWQDAIGGLELKIVSRKPGKLDIRFRVQE